MKRWGRGGRIQLAVIALHCLWGASLQAGLVTGQLVSPLSSPNVITFDEPVSVAQQATVTTQFHTFGADFLNFGFDNGTGTGTLGVSSANDFSGSYLANGSTGFPSGAMQITFNNPVTDAVFAALTGVGGNTIDLIAKRNGSTVATISGAAISQYPGNGFFGFTGMSGGFNEIDIASLSTGLAIDNVQFINAPAGPASVPEPSSMVLLGVGFAGLCGRTLRRGRAAVAA